jgi:hypothetical protein
VCLLAAGLAIANASSVTSIQSLLSRNRHTTRDLQKKFFGDHEQMMTVQGSPEEINIDPRSTYNQKFMALMNSPCRPEKDGFFGATSGDPIRIQYGFRLEIEPLSNVMSMLDIIEDKIVDSVLMNTFPNMCGLRRRRTKEEAIDVNEHKSRFLGHLEGHPSGFRFMKFGEVGTYRNGDKIASQNFVSKLNLLILFSFAHERHLHSASKRRQLLWSIHWDCGHVWKAYARRPSSEVCQDANRQDFDSIRPTANSRGRGLSNSCGRVHVHHRDFGIPYPIW